MALPWNCIFDEGIDELPQLLTEVKPAGTNSSGASFPAVVVILNQYLDWFGAPSALKHGEDFTAYRHRTTAEEGPKALVSICPAWMLQPFSRQPLRAKPRTLP